MLIDKILPDNYVRNDRHKTLLNIVYTSHWVMEKLNYFLEQEDITSQQYNILRILNLVKVPLSTLKIREMMLDKMSDTSRIVDRMQKKDLVHKQISKKDKRLVDVTLTEKGVAIIARLESNNEKLDAMISNLTNEEVIQLGKLLNKMRDK